MKYLNYTFLIILFFLGSFNPIFAQLTESFEGAFPPAGWTLFDNDPLQNLSTQQWRSSSLNANTGDAHAYVRFENTDFTAEDWLVTPALLPDEDNHSLTFYATDDVATNYGSVYTVRISTSSQTNKQSFVTVGTYLETDFTSDVYQQFMVSLMDYIGQEIFVAFVLENDNGDSFFLDDVVGPPTAPVAAVPNCDANLIIPATAADVSVSSNIIWQAATGIPAGYRLQIGTTTGGEDFLPLTDLGTVTTYTTETNFAYSTEYFVTILPYNAIGDALIGNCQEFTFVTEDSPNIVLDCGSSATPVDGTLCYGNAATEEFVLSSNNGSQVKLLFNSGSVENDVDEVYIYDGTDDTGNLLNSGQPHGNAGDFAGLSYTSTTGSLFFRLVSDVNQSCLTGEQTAFTYTASCAACNPPSVELVSTSCNSDNSQFLVKLNVGNLVDGAVVVSNSQNNSTQTISSAGVVNVGAFDLGVVELTITHSTNTACNVSLPAIEQYGCIPANDECINATEIFVEEDNTCDFSGTTRLATFSELSNLCTNDLNDVWYHFTPTATGRYLFALSTDAILAEVNIYEGNCTDGLTSLDDCTLEENVAYGLTETTTYLVQVYNNDNTAMDFNLCVVAVPEPPANDLCLNSTPLVNNSNTNLTEENATYATSGDVLNCNNNPAGRGLWYQFMGTGTTLDVLVNPDLWDTELQLWSGADCNNLSCEMLVDENNTGGTESIANFTTVQDLPYYLYVGHSRVGGSAGTFALNTEFELPLAVEIQNLTGQATGSTNILSWKSADERNVNAYLIERSPDGQEGWKEVGRVEANQVSSEYIWEDKSPLELSYYRLRLVESNGNAKLSSVIAIQQGAENNITIYPVPARDRVVVEYFMITADEVILSLIDVLGRSIYRQEANAVAGKNVTEIELGDLDSGIYYITLKTSKGINTIRAVKQ